VNRNRPLIDFGLVGLMEPTTLVGTVFGVMLNHIFPNWLILVLLVTLLSFTTFKTIRKGNTVRARTSYTQAAVVGSIRLTSVSNGRSFVQIQDKESKLQLALIKSTLKGGPNGGGRGRQWSIYRVGGTLECRRRTQLTARISCCSGLTWKSQRADGLTRPAGAVKCV
jgi:hypothetical protein